MREKLKIKMEDKCSFRQCWRPSTLVNSAHLNLKKGACLPQMMQSHWKWGKLGVCVLQRSCFQQIHYQLFTERPHKDSFLSINVWL